MIDRFRRKKFGQNYLKDILVLSKMYECINPKRNDFFIEIGPGQGALTNYLLKESSLTLKAIDIDKLNIDFLKKKFSSYKHAEFIHEDFLKYDLEKLDCSSIRIVGNLPYNVSTQIIMNLLSYHKKIKDMHFLVQKEVAIKINGKIKTKNWSKLAIKISCFFESEMLFNVYPESFDIKPKVDSTFIRLTLKPKSLIIENEIESFFKFVDDALITKRKTIKNNLKKYNIDWDKLNINPASRTEELNLETLIRLFRSLS